MNTAKQWTRVFLAFLLCLVVRLIPFRAPNVEPLLAVQMPFAKRYGVAVGFLFGVASIVAYDIITGKIGVWTLITALAYGSLGILSALYFKNRAASRKNFVIFAVLGTLFYDAVTGLSIGPLFFHESFSIAFAGQIPFTALHLFGSIIFAALLSPAIYRSLTYERKKQYAETSLQPITIPLIIHSL